MLSCSFWSNFLHCPISVKKKCYIVGDFQDGSPAQEPVEPEVRNVVLMHLAHKY